MENTKVISKNTKKQDALKPIQVAGLFGSYYIMFFYIVFNTFF